MDPTRARHSGSSQKLIVALDIGTTFSSAAYAISDPGHAPDISYVIWNPDNPNPDSARIPSTLYYDHNGNFRGVEGGVDFQDDALVKVKWWKLMLSPVELPVAMASQMSTELPGGKTIIDVFADFMRYLFDKTTEAIFKSSELDGKLRWDSESIELVLTHPNGWGDSQRAHLRNAAVKAGIIQDTPAEHARVHFVSEGEASFNFCATHTQAGENLELGEQVLIINAGGGTIDISTYKVLSNEPLRAEELYEPKCLVQGGELVTARATDMVKEKLRNFKFDSEEDLEAFSHKFDEEVQKVLSVSNSRADQYVKLGSSKYDDPSCGVSRGKLTLTDAEVYGFFKPSIRSTVDAIRDNPEQRLPTNSFAFLVGGFATNPWLSEQLQRRLSDLGFRFCKPDILASNAVAIGAVLHYTDRFVTARKEERRDTTMNEEVGQLRGETGDPIELVAKQEAEIQRLRASEQELIRKCSRRDNRIARLRGSLQEMEAQARQSLLIQKELNQTKELLQARTAELTEAQAFLSKVDRLSEMEVLGIVRDLNENILQLAASLTAAWERLRPPQATGPIKVDLTSQPCHSVLVQLARRWDLTGLTFLLQSRLCYQAVIMTSSWVHNQELGGLGSVYQHLSASEGQATSARWRSLTHSYLLPSPPQSASVKEEMVKKKVKELVEELAGILNQTGFFPSLQQSSKFVRDSALEGIKSMIETARRLETAFMVDVASSDMSLLYGYPDTMFDEAKMTNDFGPDSACKPGEEGKIVGTTEVGVEKSICGQGETRRAETLLKVKVVLEKDVVGGGM